MTQRSYDPDRARSLSPLLASIGRELEERTHALVGLEGRLEALARDPFADPEEARALVADISTQRRELRNARKELEHLGCSVVGTTPLTIRIPTQPGRGARAHSLVWQRGHDD